jgi:hypothetical protein
VLGGGAVVAVDVVAAVAAAVAAGTAAAAGDDERGGGGCLPAMASAVWRARRRGETKRREKCSLASCWCFVWWLFVLMLVLRSEPGDETETAARPATVLPPPA